ncbi:hypothetical protein QBC35DRAFT_492854 [Podospora australis]|uniref:Conserved oligomeric Golgi complex subunit 1 n=1 Tax=Podospora australis TaxID=1536484 RepID=A0AAN6WXU1_9PEZI|nr:hypothetical protein QBC35DRAFT_492854 [Podospora australis]
MSTQIDLTTLPGPWPATTSSQIFSSPSYTLPQIRALHKSLHAQIDDKASRLRTQVGESYRELLGTADTIVTMKDEMESVQEILGKMGGRCGRGVVSAKSEHLRKFGDLRTGGVTGEQAKLGRERLLQGCLGELEALLRLKPGGQELVDGARLYVLGRLLVKSLPPKQSEACRKRLEGKGQTGGYKGRLMKGVDAVLRNGREKDMKGGHVLKALTAYSLITGSGARDVLRHFLTVRGEAIALALEVGEDERMARDPKDILRAFGLYTKTLQDVQALVPGKLTEALVELKREKLLENEGLKKMEGLRLDVYRRWCGDEIQFYTPFIRHDDLDGKTAREMLTSWADKGGKVLLQGLEKTMEDMGEFKAIVELRTSVLQLWIAEGGKARGFDPSVIMDQIRNAINKEMVRVLEAKVSKLRLVGSEVSAALSAWREGTTDQHQSLWDMDSYDTDLSNGAAQFTQDVIARLYGRNDAVSKAVTSYKSWFRVIDDVGTVVDQLKRQRWDNDLEEIEDEETIEERQQLLAKDDPATLSGHLNRTLVDAFRKLEEHLATIWDENKGSPNKGAIAMYFLRLIRDIRSRLPKIDEIKEFGLSSVPSLHQALASTVVISPLDEFATVALTRKTLVGRALWEGEPALPGSPSPGALKFLRNLTMAMGDAGGDLWSPTAVAVLTSTLRQQLAEVWLEAVNKLVEETKQPETETDGKTEDTEKAGKAEKEAGDDTSAEDEAEKKVEEKPNAEDEEAKQQQRDLLVQWLYDICYLKHFIASSDSDSLKKLEDTILEKLDLENSTSATGRLNKASEEYFKRTSLLFSLLT